MLRALRRALILTATVGCLSCEDTATTATPAVPAQAAPRAATEPGQDGFWKWLADFASAGLSAFIGAYVAFRYEAGRERNRGRHENMVAAKLSLLQLYRQYNQIQVIYLDDFKDHEHKPELQRSVEPSATADIPLQPRVEASQIGFILEHSDADILADVLLLQDKYQSIVEATNKRSEIHLQFQNDYANHQKVNQTKDGGVLPYTFNPVVQATLLNLTNAIYRNTGTYNALFTKVWASLVEAFSRELPGVKMLRVVDAPAQVADSGPAKGGGS